MEGFSGGGVDQQQVPQYSSFGRRELFTHGHEFWVNRRLGVYRKFIYTIQNNPIKFLITKKSIVYPKLECLGFGAWVRKTRTRA
jgi:hypothetical protein